MINKLKQIKNKIRYHAYSVPVWGWVLRNTVGRRARSNAVRSKAVGSRLDSARFSGDFDAAKIALTVWALHYHPHKQVYRSKFTVKEFNFGRSIGVLIEVPSRKSLKKVSKA